MNKQIDWPKQFEIFLSKRRVKIKGQWICAWDAWCYFFYSYENQSGTIDDFFHHFEGIPDRFLSLSYLWIESDLGFIKSERLNSLWLEKVAELKITQARKGAFGHGLA